MRGDIGWPRPALSARLVALNIGTRVIDSSPAATTTSCVPDMTACAANWIACCDDPHCRSIDTAATTSGNAEARTARSAQDRGRKEVDSTGGGALATRYKKKKKPQKHR